MGKDNGGNSDDTRSIAARGGATVLTSQLIKLVLQFVSTVVLARLLTPEIFGLMAMVLAVTTMAEVLRDFGLSTAVLNARTISPMQQSNLFWVNTGIGFGCTVVMLLAAPLLGLIYDQPEIVDVALVVAIVFTLNGMSTQFITSVNRQLRFRALMLIDLAPQIISTSIAVTLAVHDCGIWSLAAQQISLSLITLLLSWTLSGWTPNRPTKQVPIREFVVAGGHVAGTRILSVIAQNAPSMGIGVSLGASQLGIFNRAFQLCLMPLNQINAPMTRVALPLLSELSTNNQRFSQAIRKSQSISLYLTAPLLLLMAGLSSPIVEILLGPGWEPVAPILTALCIGGAFRAISQVTFWVFVSKKLTRQQLRFSSISQPLIAAITLVGLFWGTLGVAIAHSVAYCLVWAMGISYIGRLANIPARDLMVDAIRTLTICGAPIAFLAYFAASFIDNSLASVLAAVVGALIYMTLICLVSKAIRSDILYLTSLIRALVVRRRAR